ncbi:3-oxoacyl-ACP synthase III family protein [Paraburkholderia sp. Cpub6]|uniref:3-oxoacyl-ACP synthase III family protein n=1 Tax=Paraburkholderia sp. Cpub6 TaxID=2723094 RepID=UPI001607354A|nr:3-oxoacyl-[acyl-carrier-protein] synthase III C-terminal domain-containing protein [Paraburkholderia sp. Cpub6]MBB5463593.1 3-oxoacyl-[acyl-carrier-protein] synthase-3 [Paraburkholderia sp. Cpub6]
MDGAHDTKRNAYARGSVTVLGTGFALPGAPLDNRSLFERVGALAPGLSARAMIATARRLSIDTRHVSRAFRARAEAPLPGARNPELAARAVRRALDEAGLDPGELGYLIGHTATPAQPLPSNIALVADELDYAGPHVELRQACTGFANALLIAFGMLADPDARPVAIVGSETGSLFFDPASAAHDRDQRVNLAQMGDAAAAVVLGPARPGTSRLRAVWFGALGLHKAPGLEMRAGGADCSAPSALPLAFVHDYKRIAQTGTVLFDAGVAAAEKQGVALDEVDWIIPHQTSGRIGVQLAAHFDVPSDKVFVNADRVGNTGSAAIWLALAQLRERGLASDTRVLALGAEATKYMHGGFLYEQG